MNSPDVQDTYSTLAELIREADRAPFGEVCLRYEAQDEPPYTRAVLSLPGDARALPISLQVKLASTGPRQDAVRLGTMAQSHHEEVKKRLLAAGLRVRVLADRDETIL